MYRKQHRNMYIKGRISALLLITALIAGLTSCTKIVDPPPTTTNTSGGDAPTSPDQQKMLDLVNEARTQGHQCGSTYYPPVGELTWNTKLEQAAQKHSEYMERSGNFDHTGDGGSDAGDRITAEGYNWSSYGENIADGYPTEEKVMQAWLESPGHCKNIMDADYKEMGVATSGTYWTQVFGTQQ